MKNLKFKIQNWFLLFCILNFSFLISCKIPNLESPECTESRDVVKEFYSFHLGNDMKFSPQNLLLREKFLSPEYIESLKNVQSENDVFTDNSTDFPKTFSVAGCQAINADKTDLTVLLFWKNDSDSKTIQKAIHAETVKENGKWLINKIKN